MDWKFGVGRYKLLHIEWINSNILTYSTGNYTEYPMIKHNRKDYKKECTKNVHMYIIQSLCFTAETGSTF